MAKHAFLSASSCARWLACTKSAALNAQAGSTGSPYAQEGTDAHSLCEYLVLTALGREAKDPTEDLSYYDQEMQDCAEGYRDFCMEGVETAKALCPDPMVGVEEHLEFSRWVPQGFGTGDCVIVADDLLQIIDFKYGRGIEVSADHNPQLMCYALGAVDAYDGIYDIRRISLNVYQPRLGNVDSWEVSKEELLDWAENTLAPAAKLAYAGEGTFKAGDHCQFCKVKATCRERADYNMKLAQYDFADPALLEPSDIAAILPKIDQLTSWASDVKDYALQQALSGVHYDGFKVVAGRSVRKYTNETAVAEAVTDAGYDPYEQKLLGITAMTRMLGRTKFNEILGDLIDKPQGKPVLVTESDKRPEYSTANNDFMEE